MGVGSGSPGSELDRLFELSPALLCIASEDGYFKRVNPAFQQTLGHAEAVLLSRPFIEFVHPDDRQSTVNELGKLSSGTPAVHFENRYRHADGSYRWLLWNSTPVADDGVLYAAAIDITDRRHANEMFRHLLHSAPDSILITDRHGRILRVNRASEALFGYSSDELVGRSIELVVPDHCRDTRRTNRDVRAEALPPRSTDRWVDLYGVRKDGSEFPVEISLGPGGGPQGQVICVVRDLSRRRLLEHELQERGVELLKHQRKLQALASRLVQAEESERRRIARGLHDDVGQTLLAAKMSLGTLLESDQPGERDAAARELRSFLDSAIQTTRTLTFELSSAVLYEVGLGAALQSECARAEQQSGIRFEPPSGLNRNPIPEKTRVVLYRVGCELIRNVIKHSQARSARLSLSLSGRRVRLAVEDDGRGFEVAKGLRSPDEKAGFGLFSIIQHLDPIGGLFEIESSMGAGTRAVVTVPLDARGEPE